MNRPVSPLLHDYKQSVSGRPKKSKALQWFAVGFGLPLMVVALISALNDPTPTAPKTMAPAMSADINEPPVVPPVDPAELLQEAVALLPEPLPAFETLVLRVASGDTMEKLFRNKTPRKNFIIKFS